MFVLNKLKRYIVKKYIPTDELSRKYNSNYVNCLELGFYSAWWLTVDEITNKYKLSILYNEIIYILKTKTKLLRFQIKTKDNQPRFQPENIECTYQVNELRYGLYNYHNGTFRNLRTTKFILSDLHLLIHYYYIYTNKLSNNQNYKLWLLTIKPHQIYTDITLYYTNNTITKIKTTDEQRQVKIYKIEIQSHDY